MLRDRLEEIEAWVGEFSFAPAASEGDYLMRMRDLDSNVALWKSGPAFVFGVGLRDEPSNPMVSSTDLDSVAQFMAWYLVSGFRKDHGFISTLDYSQGEVAEGFAVERIDPRTSRLTSLRGLNMLFFRGRVGQWWAASFSQVAPLTANQILTFGRQPEPFPPN